MITNFFIIFIIYEFFSFIIIIIFHFSFSFSSFFSLSELFTSSEPSFLSFKLFSFSFILIISDTTFSNKSSSSTSLYFNTNLISSRFPNNVVNKILIYISILSKHKLILILFFSLHFSKILINFFYLLSNLKIYTFLLISQYFLAIHILFYHLLYTYIFLLNHLPNH